MPENPPNDDRFAGPAGDTPAAQAPSSRRAAREARQSPPTATAPRPSAGTAAPIEALFEEQANAPGGSRIVVGGAPLGSAVGRAHRSTGEG